LSHSLTVEKISSLLDLLLEEDFAILDGMRFLAAVGARRFRGISLVLLLVVPLSLLTLRLMGLRS